MSSRLWLESVQDELARRKLPRHEIARLVTELTDHLADVMESRRAVGTMPARETVAKTVSLSNSLKECTSMDASVAECLGSPAEIAETAVREFRRRKNLLSRSRLAAFCTFVLAPLPALCLAWVTSLMALMAVGYVLCWLEVDDVPVQDEVTAVEALIAHVFMTCLLLTSSAAVAVLFGKLARQTAHVWHWGLAACLLVALGAALGTMQLTFSDSTGKNLLIFGLTFGADHLPRLNPGQFFITLAAGVLALRRSANSRACATPA